MDPAGEHSFTAREVQSATGLSSRQLNDWDARGALPHDRNGEVGWRRFSPRELFAIMICTELRSRFGIPIERLKYVKYFMLQEGANHLAEAVDLMARLQMAVWLMTDFEKTFIMDSELEFQDLCRAGLFSGEDPKFFVALKVNPTVHLLLSRLKDPPQLPAQMGGYDLLRKMRSRFGVATAEEFEVLQLIRSGEYQSVEVTSKAGKIATIRMTKHVDPTERIVDLMQKHDYQVLTVRMRDGKTVRIDQETTLKP